MSEEGKATRTAIIALHLKGKRPCDIIRLLHLNKLTVLRVIKRYKELGNTLDRPRSGRPPTANIARNVKVLRERIRRNFKRSMRKMAKDIGISESSVRRIVKTKLNCKSLKLKKGQLLSERVCQVRRERSAALLRRLGAEGHKSMVFTDEKLFTIEQAHNVQNDRVLSPNSDEADSRGRTVSHSQKPSSVMVWAGVSCSGRTPLIFIEKGVKINSNNYITDILNAHMLPWSKTHYADQQWIFQQDSAPSHRAKITQGWCRENFPDFLTSAEWPPYSPDLNPLDYSVWGLLQAEACSIPHKSIHSLKASLLKAWSEIDQNVLRAAIDQFPKRLRACVKARGGLFENSFH